MKISRLASYSSQSSLSLKQTKEKALQVGNPRMLTMSLLSVTEHLNSKLMLHRPKFFYFRPLVCVLTFHSFISHENIEIPGYLSKGLLLGIPHRGMINHTSNKPCLNTSSLTLALLLGYGTAHHWLSVWILLYPYCNFSFSSSPPEWNLLHTDICWKLG